MIGHLRGGLGMAAVLACCGFAAICGSSVATTATFSTVAYPEMRRFHYPQSFSNGVIAASGAVEAILTQQDIGKRFMAGLISGLLAMRMGVVTISVIVRVQPDWLPARDNTPWSERLADLKNVWAPLVLFIFVIGGLYGGFFTPTEAGEMGASGAFPVGLLRGKLDGPKIGETLLPATLNSVAVLTVPIGALLFGYFLTITRSPQKRTGFLAGLGIGRCGVLALITPMDLVLGYLMDAMAMIVVTLELGLIHAPAGMNGFVIKSVVKKVGFTTILKGVLPFIVTDMLRRARLIAFPIIAFWLPARTG